MILDRVHELLHRSNPWLHWWQEIILNWVATWPTVSRIIVTSDNGEDACEWFEDLSAERERLEALLDREP